MTGTASMAWTRRHFLQMATALTLLPATRGRAAEETIGMVKAPAESEPHKRTWMAWPSTPEFYGGPGAYFESVQETLGRLAAAIVENEPVSMAASKDHHVLAARLCGPRVDLVDIETDDMWARDSAPVFVHTADGGVAAMDFGFNGWGDKQPHARDSRLAAHVAEAAGVEYRDAGVCGEGGGFEFDGDGTLLLTESCWVNDNRNPGMEKAQIEMHLRAALGVETILWVPGVRGLDITDGHIDGSFRFIEPGLVLACGYPGDTSEWGRAHEEALGILAKARDARGRALEVVSIAAATDVRSTSKDFLSSYANYYVGNGALYTPQFGDRKADARAADILGRLHPGRRIVQLQVDRIYENGGGIHCVTQQQPA